MYAGDLELGTLYLAYGFLIVSKPKKKTSLRHTPVVTAFRSIFLVHAYYLESTNTTPYYGYALALERYDILRNVKISDP